MNENYVHKYTAYLTVTNEPQPLSKEWGEDEECDGVDVINPLYLIAPGHVAGVDVLAGADNGADILVGTRNGQHNPYLPGGNTGIRGVRKLSDFWVKTRVAEDVVRIIIEVYIKK